MAELSNYKDITIKARLINRAETETAIQSMNAHFLGTDLQTDHYFETDKGKLKWREGTIESLVTHYKRFHDNGIERTSVYRYDLNPSREMIDHLFKNHQCIGIIKKERKIYQLENIKIHIDKLPNGEEFIEIEAIDLENKVSFDVLKGQCMNLKSKLNITDSDLIPTGYLKMS